MPADTRRQLGAVDAEQVPVHAPRRIRGRVPHLLGHLIIGGPAGDQDRRRDVAQLVGCVVGSGRCPGLRELLAPVAVGDEPAVLAADQQSPQLVRVPVRLALRPPRAKSTGKYVNSALTDSFAQTRDVNEVLGQANAERYVFCSWSLEPELTETWARFGVVGFLDKRLTATELADSVLQRASIPDGRGLW